MKWKASLRKLIAFVLSVVLLLSLCTTAFAEGNEEGQGDQGGAVCGQFGGCEGDVHDPECPMYEEPETPDEGDGQEQTLPPATCTESPACTAVSHEDGCPNNPAVKAVQDLIDELPNAEAITQSNFETVTAQLATIDEAKAALSSEQQNALDFTSYDAAKAAVNNLSDADNGSTEPTPEETLQQMIDALEAALSTLDPTKEADIQSANDAVGKIYAYAEEQGLEITVEQDAVIHAQLEKFYPISANDDTPVAQIGDVTYNTLKEAFANAQNGATVTLIGNIEMATDDIATVPEGKTITLDMNGKSITVASDFEGRPIVNYGTLTITGNGTIDSSASESRGYGAVNNFGVLTIQNGTFRGSYYAYGSVVYVRPGSEAVINDGQFEGRCAVYNEGKLTINNGTFYTISCNQLKDSTGTAVPYVYCIVSSGELYFNNGSVTGVQGGLGISSGYAEVKGGTFRTVGCEHSDTGVYSFYALYIAGEVGQVEAHISGGTYTSASRVAVLCGNDNTGGDGGINAKATAYITGGIFIGGGTSDALQAGKNTGDPQITGGTFSSDVSAYVPDGYVTIDESGNYVVGKATVQTGEHVAEVNGQYFKTLQAAINAIGAGTGTVKLINNTTEDITIPADANITLDVAGGVTLTGSQSHTIANYGTLTVAGNGTIVNNDISASGALANYPGATANLNGCTFTGNKWYVIKNLGTMTIDGAAVIQNDTNSSGIDNGYYGNQSNDLKQAYPSSETKVALTIKNGSFSGGMNTVKNDDFGYLTIENGTFTNTSGPTLLNWNVATLNGGTYTVNDTASSVIANGYYASNINADQGVLTINTGTFTAPNNGSGQLFGYGVGSETGGAVSITGGTFIGKVETSSAYPYTPKISGGTFSSEVSEEYCADGYYPNKNADGTYSVHEHNYDEPVFTWTGTDNCTVTISCKTCGDALTQPCTVTKTTIPATATESEKTVYTATATIDGKSVTSTKTVSGLAILAGQNQSYALYSGEAVTIRCSGALNDFVSVSVDGTMVDSSNYTTQSGSTVLTFSSAYLNTLSLGDHTVTMNYKPGVYMTDSVSSTLTVTAGWEKLSIEVKANRSSVRPGKTITYTLTVTNNTGTNLTDIVVSNTVDKNLIFSSSSGTGTYVSKNGLWTIPELKDGKTAKITLKFTVKSGVKDGTKLNYSAVITDADAENGETLPAKVTSDIVTVKVSNKISIIPGTGDTSNIGMWTTIMVAAFVALIVLGVVFYIKNRKKK